MILKTGNTLRGWAGLALGLALVWAFMFKAAPWFERYECVATVTRYIESEGIEAGEIWWSDVGKVADAAAGAMATVTYTPTGPEPER